VRITFLGTRGYIDARTRRHRMHASLLVAHRGVTVMVDCGADWLGRVRRIRPRAIVVTHAHPDHARGLLRGTPCPVYATAAAWRAMRHFPIEAADRRVLRHGRVERIAGIEFTAHPVAHSLRAPAVGYRIGVGGAVLFYAPDLVAIADPARALRGVQLYVGDGASVSRPIIRRRMRVRIGHTPIVTQLEWCAGHGIGQAIFTHCGTAIVGGDERAVQARVAAMGAARGVQAALAYDGMTVVVRSPDATATDRSTR
jgi:phosphoribosyl 1,2-cyclic phosphodiesterase